MADQNSQFYAILTNVGAAKQANADALGIPWKITHMGVGDANGAEPIPNASQTSLIAEWRRAPLNQLKVDDNNSSIIVAEQVIPADEGGKWIREVGLYDIDGNLVAVANCPPTFKPKLSQGSGRTQVVRLNLIVSSSSNVELKIDPALVLATREWVTSELAKQDFKHSVVAATTGPVALSGLQTVDGVALAAGARVLVKNQDAAKDNGIYVAATAAWARSTDADVSAEVTPGMLVLVERGIVNADSAWQLVTDAPITLGVTALVYEMAFGRTGVAAGTYRSVTVDAYGRVTAASNPTTVAGYGLTDVYTKTELDQALSLKANVASPTFTGAVSVPTPAAGNNSKLAANTEFVQVTIAALIAAAPGALDTLNELAAALGNDPNFAATVTNALALKAPLASPAFTGVPTGPSPALLDISQKFATTDFVKQAGLTYPTNTAEVAVGSTLTPYCIGRITLVSGTGVWAGAVTLPTGVPPGSVFTISVGGGMGTLTVNAPAAAGSYLAMGSSQFSSIQTKWSEAPLVVVCIADGIYAVLSGGDSSAYGFQASLAGLSGYQRLPSGLIEQWGWLRAAPNSTTTITLPIAFPNAFKSVFPAVQDNIAYVDSHPIVTAIPINAGSFSLRSYYTASDISVAWRAIGY
ncbi:phage tail protein [Pseudomonas plecoglossicida]|uniref:phage tail protein n=1 Tax=Pseudomonas TaxID=286 RepID=UPI0002A175BA|nr:MULTISPECIES: phage tail protein [Pseudomonas]AGA74252.1 Phage-related tail fiber protein-like protein [Pseudomonas putida HB3267]MCE0942025.1 phage tail protein [Pseudomonas asiatica]MCE0953125.1 phage tail protein [Pseudomonas asiatica]MCE1062458.1 phage tail protein [Pseudomonas asiatica]MCE1097779.1 phage tail protein [Pseudomonas asiatica]